MIKTYGGIDALPGYRKKLLLEKLQKTTPNITNVSAEYLHFANLAKSLDPSTEKKLQALLTYDTKYLDDQSGKLLLVVPRFGTISPWSSKATDIAHNCGLESIVRLERGTAYYIEAKGEIDESSILKIIHDRMTEVVLRAPAEANALFTIHTPKTYQEINIATDGMQALIEANSQLGLALSDNEIDYLFASYSEIMRNPTDVELMMFAAVNSEHCRHKVFNADWVINGKKQPKSLFKMIKNTYEKNPSGVLSAYSDNAAVLKGPMTKQFWPTDGSGKYSYHEEPSHLVIKAETHNHPTAIAPFPGAATGVGGEIRDEGATGRGGRSKLGYSGFSVSNLNLPDLPQPWELDYGKPDRIASPLNIMIEGPLGGAAFANEFGRPNLAGYFRTFEQEFSGEVRGYHKPLMLAGGLGSIRERFVAKKKVPAGAKLIVLGGPSMLIGLGGGAASSMGSGQSDEQLDFASVQRGSAEMQRRAQEVISACWAMDDNPILSIHDIGAGGLSNGLPELVHDNGLGAEFELRDVPSAEPGMSPLEIWCNEAQERYVLAINESDVKRFIKLCQRERCPYAIVGTSTSKQQLVVRDRHFKNTPVDIPMQLLFGNPPKMTKIIDRKQKVAATKRFDFSKIRIDEAVERVLRLPAVASKKFLITIGDRTVGGLTVRDQMVGPWQVPVADVAVSASSYHGHSGEAVAIGEKAPIALLDAAASVRMAVGEAITNIAAASIKKISDIKLSANWMAAVGSEHENQNLFDGVRALGEDFCPKLGICIPVGKDSLSMRSQWQEKGINKSVTSPLSLVISAFSTVTDTRKLLTPELQNQPSVLVLIDLGQGQNRLGGSALAQVYSSTGGTPPDISPELLGKFFKAIQKLNSDGRLLSYHDRSDGGLFTCLAEMAFAGRRGLDIMIDDVPGKPLEILFNEELGAVIQIPEKHAQAAIAKLRAALGNNVYNIGKPSSSKSFTISSGGNQIYTSPRNQLEAMWAETSYHIQKLRDNPKLAAQEFQAINDDTDPGISPLLSFEFSAKKYKTRRQVAILREEGINGQIEMAAAFDMAGFESIDVHLNDLLSGRHNLANFSVLAVCGGFSYGDVMGAGEGWAKLILFNPDLKKQFQDFFERPDTLSLGLCNGCQMLAALKVLIPGAKHWPRFLHNDSGRFEARLTSVKINDTPSVFFKGMAGSILPVPVAHGEGKAVFADNEAAKHCLQNNLAPLQYVDNLGKVTKLYPFNPNGSEAGITSLTSTDGRATILMPHPERVFLSKQLSWHPNDWPEESPWLKMFQNARDWLA